LNNCILTEGSTGQLIIILDCDMLPEPCMARTVAPFFYKKLSTAAADVAADVAASSATGTPVLSAAASPAKRNPSQIESDIAPAAGTAAAATVSVASAAAAAADAAAAAAAAVLRAKRTAEFDLSVGLLQTPQAFYNLDSDDLLGQSYGFFYECVLSGWDGAGCTPCCGTGVTFSR
jgi:hypothetical protein